MTVPPIDNSSHGLAPREPADEQRAYALVEAVTSMCAVIANRGLLAQAVSDLIGQHLDARCTWVEEGAAGAPEVGSPWREALRQTGRALMPIAVGGVGARGLGAIHIELGATREIDGLMLVALTGLAHTLALTLERLARDEERGRMLVASEREAQRWLSILEAAGHGAWEWNLASRQISYSRQWKAVLGYTEDEIEDGVDAWSPRVHPEDLPAAMEALVRHLEGKTPFYSSEHRIRCKNGAYRWVLSLGKVVARDAEGRPVFALGTHTDVTEQKRVDAHLAELETTHAIAESIAHLGSWRWEFGSGEVHWSAEVCRIFGVDPEHFVPSVESFLAAVHGDDREAVRAVLAAAAQGDDDTYDIEHRIVRPDGEIRWVHERGKIARATSGANLVINGMVHDVTETRRHQRRLGFLARRAEVLLELQSLAREHSERDLLRFAVERLGLLVSSGCARVALMSKGQPGSARPSASIGEGQPSASVQPEDGAGVVVVAADCEADKPLPIEVRILDGGHVRMLVGCGAATEDEDDDRETLSVVGREVWRLVRSQRDEAARTEAEMKFRAIAEQSIAGIYLVSDRRILWINRRGAAILGYAPEELVGQPVHDHIAVADHGLVGQREDQHESGENVQASITLRARHRDGHEVLMAVGSNAITLGGRKVIVGVVQDVTEERQAQARAQGYLQRLERSVVGTLEVISRMMSLRDPYTSGHERRVGEIAAAIGAELGLPSDRCAGLRFAGLVHDVGKITAPAEILSKPGRLTPTEYALIKTHAEHGYEILKGIDFPWPVAEVARQHHERMDGSGYPDGRVGEAIVLEARIVAVADVVESMASHRPYRAALGIEAALAEIERGAGRLYDAAVAAACVRLFRDRGYTLPIAVRG